MIAVLFFAIPLAGLLWRAPWSSAWSVLSTHDARAALRLSIETSLAATAIAIVLGVPLAWVQARVVYPGRRVVRAAHVAADGAPAGGRRHRAAARARAGAGSSGQYLDNVGVHLPFHVMGAVIAETFVAMPFLVLTVEAAFRRADRRYEEAARTLGRVALAACSGA